MTDEGILTEIDNLALQMDDTHRAVVIAPAGVLSDRIRDRSAEAIRDGLLRLGRVRGVVRLPKGLVPNKPRQALALWALGPAHDDVAVQDRWTMVADLTDTELDPAATSDLVNDLIVTMADRATVGAHAFRFARPVPTRNLLAGRGDLVARGTSVPRPPRAAASHLAVRIAELRGALSDTTSHTGLDFQVRVTERVEVARTVVPLDELVAAGQVRLIPGNRLDPGGLPGGAVHLVDAEDLATGVRHGARNVDRVALFAKHPGCRLTEPGDVVFCTSPRPAAWVDEEGGSVVLAPARTLRVHQQSRRGLHPRLLATDINAVPSERREWRTWPVRQVPPAEQPALADVLMNIEQERISTISRLARLGELERLVIRGVANGSLTLTAETHL